VERAARLRKGNEFDSVYSTGTVVSGPLLALRYLPNQLGHVRWGFAVGKRTAKLATDRNRTKRRLRDAAERTLLILSIDIVVTARRGAPQAPYAALERALGTTLRRAGLTPASPSATIAEWP
jgi:ribonuclease P protein component